MITIHFVKNGTDCRSGPYDNPVIAAKTIVLIEQDRRLAYDDFEAETPEEVTAVCDAYAALTANPIPNSSTER